MKSVSQRLKDIMRERKLKQVDILSLVEPIANEYGVKFNKSHMSHYVNNTHAPQDDKVFVLAKALGVTEAWLLGYDVAKYPEDRCATEDDLLIVYRQLDEDRKDNVLEYAEVQLREQDKVVQFKDYVEEKLYGYASAGAGQYIYENPVESIIIPKSNVPSSPYDIVLQVSGDSMRPTFEHGEYVFVKKTKEVRNGQFAVFIINGESYLKKVYVENGRLILISLNEKYPAMIFNENDNIELVGTVVL